MRYFLNYSRPSARDCLSALYTGILNVLGTYSFASILFTGPLASYRLFSIQLLLLSNIVGCLLGARLNQFPLVMILTHSSILGFFALMNSTIVHLLAKSAPSIDPFYTVCTAMIVVTLLSGAFLWLLGMLKVGKIIHRIPFPVIAAFLAGSGWLLLLSSVGVFFNETSTSFEHMQWGLSLGTALLCLLLQKCFPGKLVDCVLYPAVLFLFYLWAAQHYTSFTALQTSGWYIPVHNLVGSSVPLPSFSIEQIQWQVFLNWDVLSKIVSVLCISPLFLLFNLNGIEKETFDTFNYNRELKSVGFINITIPFFGGMALVIPSLPATLGNYQIEASSAWVNVLTALFFSMALLFGAFFLEAIPLFMLISFPIMAGMYFLKTWLIESRSRVTRLDYYIIWFIFFIISAFGFVPGIIVGLLTSLLVFDYQYSKIPIIQKHCTGRQLHSNSIRGLAATTILEGIRNQIHIYLLQGYLFFGNLHTFIEQVNYTIRNNQGAPISFILLDFKNTQDIDLASTECFLRLHRVILENDIMLLFTHLSVNFFEDFLRFLKIHHTEHLFKYCTTLDEGLQWCENELLRRKNINWDHYFQGQLYTLFPNNDEMAILKSYLQISRVSAEEVLFSEGDTIAQLFFLEAGSVQYIYSEEKYPGSLSTTLYPGTVLGEEALYSNTPHTFHCVTQTPCILFTLSFDALLALEAKHPKLALTLYRYLMHQTLHRLTDSQHTLFSLL